MSFFSLGDHVDEKLRKILVKLESSAPTVLVNGGSTAEEAVLADRADWEATLLFAEPTDDGKLGTVVLGHAHAVVLSVEFTPPVGPSVTLAQFHFTDGKDPFVLRHHTHVLASKATVRFVRDYVRRRSLPYLQDARARRAIEAERNENALAALRQKYIP